MESVGGGAIPTSPPGRLGHCTFVACKPAPGWGPTPHPPAGSGQDMGSGQLLTPLETQNLWRSHGPHPHCSGFGKEEDRKCTKTPEFPATEQGMLGEGKEPGEILEVALSPAKVPGPLPGGSANGPLSSPTPAKPRARHPVPYYQPTRNK